MHRHLCVAIALTAIVSLSGCSGSSSQNSSSSSTTTTSESPSPSAAPVHTALPTGTKTPITFNFNDVSVATGSSNLLRLGFDIANKSSDPLLCDSSEFYAQLDDGTVLAADGSADNTCTPDSVDPNSNGKAVMYFNLPGSYTGGLKLFIVVNDTVIGQGSTTIK